MRIQLNVSTVRSTCGEHARTGPILMASTLVAAAVCVLGVAAAQARGLGGGRWTAQERTTLASLALSALEPLPADPSNRYADDPRAAALGRDLFFDARLSGNGQVSCGTCHLPSQEFQDGKPLAEGIGTTARRTMPIAGTAHSEWLFWDGRSDNQWGQALGPLENPVEHGGNRTRFAHVVLEHYRLAYESVFGAVPDLAGLPHDAGPVLDSAWNASWQRIPAARREDVTRLYVNIGKAIAAFERRIEFGASRFDRYVEVELSGRPHDATTAFTADEEAGLRLFIGKANCVNCHNGPLFTDNHFHNTGIAPSRSVSMPDSGRLRGVREALASEFSCTSRYSDARAEECEVLRFAVTEGDELVRAYKTPTLRNVAQRPPYMHAGQLGTLAEVIRHYDAAPAAPFGHSELRPLRLSARERKQIEAFLHTLSGPLVAPLGHPDESRREEGNRTQ